MPVLSDTALKIIWVVMLIFFAVAEAATVQLVSVWFAIGSFAALIANVCGLSIVWQVVIFAVISVLSLLATRPFVKKFTNSKVQKTNLDRCIGKNAVVTEKIDNLRSTGQAKTDGKIWTARSDDDSVIPVDAVVTVLKIEGVKLIVKENK